LGELAQLVDASEDEIASYEDGLQPQMTPKMQFLIMRALDITPEQFRRTPAELGRAKLRRESAA
jgi:hypothetical protein